MFWIILAITALAAINWIESLGNRDCHFGGLAALGEAFKAEERQQRHMIDQLPGSSKLFIRNRKTKLAQLPIKHG